MKVIWRWFTWTPPGESGQRRPVELVALRVFLAGLLVFLVAETATTRPYPGIQGRGLAILVAIAVLVVTVVSAQPWRDGNGPWVIVAMLAALTAASAVLCAEQPNGVWQFGPTYVAIIAAARLERRMALAVLVGSMAVLFAVTESVNHGLDAVSLLVSVLPWFLIMRMLRAFREQRDELAASRAAHAQAAAAAERGRIARELHDVLAHSLSALALTLESARLLARDRDSDEEVCRALDRAHHLAAGGLEEARRAIAVARGEELPGPERLERLTEAFAEQSSLPVSFDVSGEPRTLPREAGLAVYRTAQEALTNIRRHAVAERVEVRLDYRLGETVLLVEDQGAPDGVAVPVGAGGAPTASESGGYGLTGMRERAALLGGELLAAPTGTGFRVELRLPV